MICIRFSLGFIKIFKDCGPLDHCTPAFSPLPPPHCPSAKLGHPSRPLCCYHLMNYQIGCTFFRRSPSKVWDVLIVLYCISVVYCFVFYRFNLQGRSGYKCNKPKPKPLVEHCALYTVFRRATQESIVCTGYHFGRQISQVSPFP